MGLTECHWFEDEERLSERQLERAIEDEKAAYKRGYEMGLSTNANEIVKALKGIITRLQEYDAIMALPNCNDCGKAQRCEYLPGWGETVRFNCPLWEAEVLDK